MVVVLVALAALFVCALAGFTVWSATIAREDDSSIVGKLISSC